MRHTYTCCVLLVVALGGAGACSSQASSPGSSAGAAGAPMGTAGASGAHNGDAGGAGGGGGTPGSGGTGQAGGGGSAGAPDGGGSGGAGGSSGGAGGSSGGAGGSAGGGGSGGFSKGGVVVQHLGTTAPTDMAIQSDGKILVATTDAGAMGQRAIVYRFNPSGSQDLAFGASGKAVFDSPSGVNSFPVRLAVAPDNTFYFEVNVQAQDHDQIGVARYSKNGALDKSFGSSGIVEESTPGFDRTIPSDMALRSGGLLITGTADILGSSSPPARAALGALQADGALDPAFGTGGIETQAWGHTTVASGGLVAAGATGTYVTGTTRDLALNDAGIIAKLQSDGALDTSFAQQGLFSLKYDHPASTLLPTQAGIYFAVSDWLTVGRVTLDGKADASFGNGGYVALTDLQGSDYFKGPVKLVVDPQGRLLWAENSTSNSELDIVAYDSSGQPDTSFATNGRLRISTPKLPRVRRMLVAPDGSVVALCSLWASYDVVLVRFFP